MILSGSNTYTGATTVNTGTLQAGTPTVTGVSGAFGLNSAVTVAGGTLDLNGFSNTIGSLSDGAVPTGVVNNSSGSAATLTVGTNANALNTTFSGTIENTGAALGLTLVGGSLQLSGANTYTGATTVTAGTLQVTGSLANTAVAVNSGGTLGGTGSIAGLVTVNSGGTLARTAAATVQEP